MTQEDKTYEQKKSELLEEICENTRAIRRVTNRILDHMHEYNTGTKLYVVSSNETNLPLN